MKESLEHLRFMLIDKRCDINEGIQNIREVLFHDVKLDQLTACLKLLKPISLGSHFSEGEEALASCVFPYFNLLQRYFQESVPFLPVSKANPQVPRI